MPHPALQGERVTLRPIADADLEPLADIIREPSVARWWDESDEPELLRDLLRVSYRGARASEARRAQELEAQAVTLAATLLHLRPRR